MDEVPISALLGNNEIIPCVEKAILTMKYGENSTFVMSNKELFGEADEEKEIELVVELAEIKDYEKSKWELNATERLEYSLDKK